MFSVSADRPSRRPSELLETIELPPGSLPMGLALSPNERRLYVANGRAQTVSVIDLDASEILAEVRVGARPWGVGLTADGRFLYSANAGFPRAVVLRWMFDLTSQGIVR